MLLLWLAACHPSVTVDAPAVATIELSPVNAEVWAPELDVVGRVRGRAQVQRCYVELHSSRFLVDVQSGQFRYHAKLVAGSNRIGARCVDVSGRVLEATPVEYWNRTPPFADAASHVVDAAQPDWLDDLVLYGIYPPLYGRPPLRSVTAALTSLAELGVTGLWLAPVMKTLEKNFGYAVTDYFALRQDYGDQNDLVELINRAHALHMRVLLDFVPNHTSSQHPYYVQAQQFGRRSHYFDFYERTPNGDSTHYFDWTDLPNLNYSHPEVRTFIIAAGRKWLDEFGADGFRVDAAWGVAKRQPDFYAEWVRHLSVGGRHAVLIAEASARDPFFLEHGFDVAYDWTNQLGQWAWKAAFESQQGIANGLREALSESAFAASRADRILRFINNNDTGARFVTRHGVPLTKAATVALLTLPGVPCLYSFDEVGGEFEPYAGVQPIVDPPHPELRKFHQQLIALRRSVPALHGPGLEILAVANQNVLSYMRPARSNKEKAVLVVINFANTSQSVALRGLDNPWARGARDLLSRSFAPISGQPLILSLSAFGYAILEAL